MSLESGQIIGTDLSANANILGTQIADKTLQFRNFSEDVFKIVKKGTLVIPQASVTGGGAGVWRSASSNAQVAHNLGYVPAFIAYATDATVTFNEAVPFTSIDNNSTTAMSIATISLTSDSINLYGTSAIVALNESRSLGPVTITYYLLQESAN